MQLALIITHVLADYNNMVHVERALFRLSASHDYPSSNPLSGSIT
jgi:hypothetical protein